MKDKEAIYEQKIKPLVDQLYELCEEHTIPFIAACQVSETSFIGSCSMDEEANDQLKIIALILEHGVPKVLFDLARSQAMEQMPVKVVD